MIILFLGKGFFLFPNASQCPEIEKSSDNRVVRILNLRAPVSGTQRCFACPNSYLRSIR